MKKLIIGILAAVGLSVACFANPAMSMKKAAYIDMTATGSVAAIPEEGVKAANIIVFGFADVETDKANENFKAVLDKIEAMENPGTVNLLSVGGQNTHSFKASTTAVIHNIKSQIDQYNHVLEKNKIVGVDLDLEGPNFTPLQIKELAQGFNELGLIVSIAPQVFTTGGSNINPENPHNLAFTTGGENAVMNTYKDAIESGYVDYIMFQAYNSGGFTIGGYDESQVEFMKTLSEAVTNCDYIPKKTKVLIGEIANQKAGGEVSIFNPKKEVGSEYNQAAILKHMQKVIPTILNDKVVGVMFWSLNNDYMPGAYGDTYAKKGAFSSAIFGAPMPADVYFTLQISNTGEYKNASVTLIVDGIYYPLGNKEGKTLPKNANQIWGTEASAQEQATVAHSNDLDTIFAKNKDKFTAKVMANSYNSWEQPISKPSNQKDAGSYTFEKGKSYNIMINPDTMAVEIK